MHNKTRILQVVIILLLAIWGFNTNCKKKTGSSLRKVEGLKYEGPIKQEKKTNTPHKSPKYSSQSNIATNQKYHTQASLDISKTNGQTLSIFLQNLKERLLSFSDFEEDWKNYHKENIDSIKINPIRISNKEEYLITAEIYPNQSDEFETYSYSTVYYINNEDGVYEIKDEVKNFLPVITSKFYSNHRITDLNNNGIKEVHLESYTFGGGASVNEKIQVIEIVNSNIEVVFELEGYNSLRFLDNTGQYAEFKVDWQNEESRHEPHKYFVTIYNYNGITFEKKQTLHTKYKHYGTDEEILNDVFGESKKEKNLKLEHVLGSEIKPNIYQLNSDLKTEIENINKGLSLHGNIYTECEVDTQLTIQNDTFNIYILHTCNRKGTDFEAQLICRACTAFYGYYATSTKGYNFLDLKLINYHFFSIPNKQEVLNKIYKDVIIRKLLSRIPKSYSNYDSFEEGVARIKYKNLWGFIDTNGKEFIETQFDTVSNFVNNFAIVRKNGRWFYINKSGIEPFHLDSFSKLYPFSDKGFASITNSYGTGLIDTNGVEILPPIYQSIEVLPTKKIIVQQDDKYGLVDEYQNEIIPLGFDYMEYIKEINNLIVVRGGEYEYGGNLFGYYWEGGDWGLINLKGELILPIIYGNLEYNYTTGNLEGGLKEFRFDSLGNCLEGCK